MGLPFLYNEMRGGVNMKFYCHAYPNALIQGVRFTKGFAETIDPRDIMALTESPLVEEYNPVALDIPAIVVDEEPALPRISYLEFTITELKKYLDMKGIEYNHRAKRDVLIKLLEEAE